MEVVTNLFVGLLTPPGMTTKNDLNHLAHAIFPTTVQGAQSSLSTRAPPTAAEPWGTVNGLVNVGGGWGKGAPSVELLHKSLHGVLTSHLH